MNPGMLLSSFFSLFVVTIFGKVVFPETCGSSFHICICSNEVRNSNPFECSSPTVLIVDDLKQVFDNLPSEPSVVNVYLSGGTHYVSGGIYSRRNNVLVHGFPESVQKSPFTEHEGMGLMGTENSIVSDYLLDDTHTTNSHPNAYGAIFHVLHEGWEFHRVEFQSRTFSTAILVSQVSSFTAKACVFDLMGPSQIPSNERFQTGYGIRFMDLVGTGDGGRDADDFSVRVLSNYFLHRNGYYPHLSSFVAVGIDQSIISSDIKVLLQDNEMGNLYGMFLDVYVFEPLGVWVSVFMRNNIMETIHTRNPLLRAHGVHILEVSGNAMRHVYSSPNSDFIQVTGSLGQGKPFQELGEDSFVVPFISLNMDVRFNTFACSGERAIVNMPGSSSEVAETMENKVYQINVFTLRFNVFDQCEMMETVLGSHGAEGYSLYPMECRIPEGACLVYNNYANTEVSFAFNSNVRGFVQSGNEYSDFALRRLYEDSERSSFYIVKSSSLPCKPDNLTLPLDITHYPVVPESGVNLAEYGWEDRYPSGDIRENPRFEAEFITAGAVQFYAECIQECNWRYGVCGFVPEIHFPYYVPSTFRCSCFSNAPGQYGDCTLLEDCFENPNTDVESNPFDVDLPGCKCNERSHHLTPNDLYTCVECENNWECLGNNGFDKCHEGVCWDTSECVLYSCPEEICAFNGQRFTCAFCYTDDQCSEGEICHEGGCYPSHCDSNCDDVPSENGVCGFVFSKFECGCREDSHCSGQKSYCDGSGFSFRLGQCVECLDSRTCPEQMGCKGGSCTVCMYDSHCFDTFRCSDGSCVECVDNGDCARTQFCGEGNKCFNCAFGCGEEGSEVYNLDNYCTEPFTCVCKSGYGGDLCKEVTNCVDSGVKPFEYDYNGGYLCDCREGWYGKNCQTNCFSEDRCGDGSHFLEYFENEDACFCRSCPEGRAGNECEKDCDVCQNGGVCSWSFDEETISGQMKCLCPEDNTGPTCSCVPGGEEIWVNTNEDDETQGFCQPLCGTEEMFLFVEVGDDRNGCYPQCPSPNFKYLEYPEGVMRCTDTSCPRFPEWKYDEENMKCVYQCPGCNEMGGVCVDDLSVGHRVCACKSDQFNANDGCNPLCREKCEMGVCMIPSMSCLCDGSWEGDYCSMNKESSIHRSKVNAIGTLAHVSSPGNLEFGWFSFQRRSTHENEDFLSKFPGVVLSMCMNERFVVVIEDSTYLIHIWDFFNEEFSLVDTSAWTSIPVKTSCTFSSVFVLAEIINQPTHYELWAMGNNFHHEIQFGATEEFVLQDFNKFHTSHVFVIDVTTSSHAVYVTLDLQKNGRTQIAVIGENAHGCFGTSSPSAIYPHSGYFNSDYALMDLSNAPSSPYTTWDEIVDGSPIIIPSVKPIEDGVIITYHPEISFFAGRGHPTNSRFETIVPERILFSECDQCEIKDNRFDFVGRIKDGCLYFVQGSKVYVSGHNNNNGDYGFRCNDAFGIKANPGSIFPYEIKMSDYGLYSSSEPRGRILSFECFFSCFIVTQTNVFMFGMWNVYTDSLCENNDCDTIVPLKEEVSNIYGGYAGKLSGQDNSVESYNMALVLNGTFEYYQESETYFYPPELVIAKSGMSDNVLNITIRKQQVFWQLRPEIEFVDYENVVAVPPYSREKNKPSASFTDTRCQYPYPIDGAWESWTYENYDYYRLSLPWQDHLFGNDGPYTGPTSDQGCNWRFPHSTSPLDPEKVDAKLIQEDFDVFKTRLKFTEHFYFGKHFGVPLTKSEEFFFDLHVKFPKKVLRIGVSVQQDEFDEYYSLFVLEHTFDRTTRRGIIEFSMVTKKPNYFVAPNLILGSEWQLGWDRGYEKKYSSTLGVPDPSEYFTEQILREKAGEQSTLTSFSGTCDESKCYQTWRLEFSVVRDIRVCHVPVSKFPVRMVQTCYDLSHSNCVQPSREISFFLQVEVQNLCDGVFSSDITTSFSLSVWQDWDFDTAYEPDHIFDVDDWLYFKAEVLSEKVSIDRVSFDRIIITSSDREKENFSDEFVLFGEGTVTQDGGSMRLVVDDLSSSTQIGFHFALKNKLLRLQPKQRVKFSVVCHLAVDYRGNLESVISRRTVDGGIVMDFSRTVERASLEILVSNGKGYSSGGNIFSAVILSIFIFTVVVVLICLLGFAAYFVIHNNASRKQVDSVVDNEKK